MSLTLKIGSLFVRTLAKPVANAIKRNAHEHERFRKYCVRFAQGLHRIDMRMRLGLLQDPAVIDRQIAREVAEAEARRKKSQAPTVKTEAEMKADEALTAKEREAIKEKAKQAHKPRIRPLTEAKAIETGANFVSEAFVFSVAIGVILFERWYSSRKEKGRRNEVQEELDAMKAEMTTLRAQVKEVAAAHIPEPTSSTLLGFFKAKPENGAVDGKTTVFSKADSKPLQHEIESIKAEITTLRTQLDEVGTHIQQHTPKLLEFWTTKPENHAEATVDAKTTGEPSSTETKPPTEPTTSPNQT
ncbi:uncharacterized protein BDZ99DRAFT_523230 [Mytilinidion resinicola]|uniref:OPA3-domain-containing protein n=1 Tax=Mytilinidion resinicola TaxID=574789 RepID=A0A6A6YD61_9PEZI|nr:uncharacterized protein BDZ99DRAFT_523230 [Mytilinidion resinicola]KAF2806650.1 hypothetical protein BDZ99DRAFT_523230 [Mytilinidion resinicola]